MSFEPRRGLPGMSDEATIRELIIDWAAAVHAGDLDSVLTDHDSDIVMFDVPPPYRGLRGMDEYREAWPPFFDWQRQGAAFEIELRELLGESDLPPVLEPMNSIAT